MVEKPFLLRLLAKAERANEPVPREAGTARQELNILGGAPLFLNRSSRRSPLSSNNALPTSSSSGPSANSSEFAPVNTPTASTMLPNRQSGCVGESYPSQNAPIWPQQRHHFSPNANALPSSSSYRAWIDHSGTGLSVGPQISDLRQYSQSGGTPFVDTTHQNRNTQDLNSAAWLQQIPNGMLSHFGEDAVGSADLDLGLLLGGETRTDPGAFIGSSSAEDPVLTEAWKSLMGYSQGFGSDIKANIH